VDQSKVDLPAVSPPQLFADLVQTEPDRAALLEQFTRKLSALKGEVFAVASMEEAARTIAHLAAEAGYQRCGRYSSPLLDRLFGSHAALSNLERTMVRLHTDDLGAPIPHTTLEQLDFAVTPADALIARTGSVVLRSTTAGGRRLSVLPPVHCVVALRSQLRASITEWLAETRADRSASFATIITGPSRTADIERIIVMGAHGPKRLIVVVVADEK
jgi:L-lactate dehydrogenase complex protein LldG